MRKKTQKFHFHRDPTSQIVTKDQIHWVSSEVAKARYDTHENGVNNVDYIAYQKSIFDEFIGIYLKQGSTLDYGCGEGAVLQRFIENLYIYDLYYHPDLSIFKRTFDHIILIEVVEHFEKPLEEFERLAALLNPGGRLIIQTQFYQNFDEIEQWWYIRDTTHVSFYNKAAFRFISSKLGLTLIYTDDKFRVVLEKSNI